VRASFAPLGYLDEPILDPYQEHPYSCGGSTIDLIILHECGNHSSHLVNIIVLIIR